MRGQGANRRGTAGHPNGDGARLAARSVEVLSSYTREGSVLAVDTRLRPPRPRGQEGGLVVPEDALRDFLHTSAGAWEVMAYLKACPVAGDREFAGRLVKRVAQ